MEDQNPIIEEHNNTKTVHAVGITALVLVVGFALFINLGSTPEENTSAILAESTNTSSAMVMVQNTPTIGGVLPVPAGFPKDIPIEQTEIRESATAQFPEQNSEQLFLSYKTDKSVTVKYAEYKSYLDTEGYSVEEETLGTSKVIVGTKNALTLTISINSVNGSTFVDLSYLLKKN